MTPAVCERSFSVYDFTSRVRYSETDADAKLSLTGIMNYFQDCSTFHSEDSGVGVSYYEREKKAWLLSDRDREAAGFGRTDPDRDLAL